VRKVRWRVKYALKKRVRVDLLAHLVWSRGVSSGLRKEK